MAAAIKKVLEHYEKGKLSLQQAAEQCGLSLYEIIDEVKKRKVYVPYRVEDLEEDTKRIEEARKLSKKK